MNIHPSISRNRQFEKRKFQGFAPKKSKPAGWSHQHDLAALRGKKVLLSLIDGEQIQGELLEADQFTLKMKTRGADRIIVIYKSALIYFTEAR